MIADWQTNKVYLSGKLRQKFPVTYGRVSQALEAYGYKPEDDVAVEQISKYYPEYATQNRIGKVFIKDITRNDGALNCISWTACE